LHKYSPWSSFPRKGQLCATKVPRWLSGSEESTDTCFSMSPRAWLFQRTMSSWTASKEPQWIMQQSPERLHTWFCKSKSLRRADIQLRIRRMACPWAFPLELLPSRRVRARLVAAQDILRYALYTGRVSHGNDNEDIPRPSSRLWNCLC